MQDLHLSGREPKIFPGLLSRPQRRDSAVLKEGDAESVGVPRMPKMAGVAREERGAVRGAGRDGDGEEEGNEVAEMAEWA